MITENMTTQVLYVIFLALKPTERWRAARHPFGASSAVEGWLTVFAMVALITAVILIIWLITDNRRSEDRLKREIAGLTAANKNQYAKYRRSEDSLKREIAGLTAANEKLQQEITKLGQQTPAKASEKMPSEKSKEVQESKQPVAIEEN